MYSYLLSPDLSSGSYRVGSPPNAFSLNWSISNDDRQVSNMQVYLNRGVQATTDLWSSDVWAKLYSISYYILYTYTVYIEREREINFIQLDLFPQGLVIALILWCIYCATSAEIQVPEGTPPVVFTLPSTLPTWHQNHLWHRLREFDTWTCAGCQCWRRPKLVLALSLLLDKWAFVIFFSLYNIRTFFCNPLKSLNTHHMFLELPVLQHVSTNIV